MEASAVAWINSNLSGEDSKLALSIFPANSILSVDDIKKLTKPDLEELSKTTHDTHTASRTAMHGRALDGVSCLFLCVVQSSISVSATA